MSATARSVHTKPSTCSGCPLEHRGYGYVPGSGPVGSPITILAEAPGYDEVALGQPMVGAAGGMLSRILARALRTRGQYRIENTLRCTPPQYEIHPSWAADAASHCSQHSQSILSQSPVIFAMGATAIRQALGFWDWDVKHLVENFHGTVHSLPSGQHVVCSYHPSFLQRGASNLIGTVIDDLAVAHEVAEGRWVRDPITPIIDPHPEWFNQVYVPQYLAMVRQDPSYWLAADVETPDKAKGKSEDELDESDQSFQILRYNFAYHPDEGITVPNEEPWRPGIQALLEAARITLWWNGEYDLRRIAAAGLSIPGECWDGMWLWHHYRSDVPKGLGFAAPSCSRHGAWKHLFLSAPAEYAAYDGPQTYRTVAGTVEGLQRRGQWDVAYRHTVQLLQEVLKPAARLGILVDRPALDAFEHKLTETARGQLATLQELVPPEQRPLTGGTKHLGLTRPPQGPHPDATTIKADGTPKADAGDADPLKVALYAAHAKLEEHTVPRRVLVCATCGATEVVAKHRCKGKQEAPPSVHLAEIPVQRWFWREPFNPDAPQQVLDYIVRKRHVPGRNKKTKNPTADKETLKRLAATTKDPFYSTLLGYRAVGKIRGTYAIGVRKRLDKDQRFHPTPTLKPSTLRTCIAQGTPIEVVRDVRAFPTGLPIEDVTPGMWAYSFDDDRQLVLRRVLSHAQTGVRSVVRIHWRGRWGGHQRIGHLDLTADHEVRLVTGAWKPAGQLQTNDRILSLARGTSRPNNQGYARLWATGHPELTREHRFVWAALGRPPAAHVHHINENTLDNRPENLQGYATAGEHQRVFHANRWPADRRQRQAKVARRVCTYRRMPRGSDVHNALNLPRQWMLDVLYAYGGKPTAFTQVYGIDYATAQKYLQHHGIDWRAIQRELGGRDYNHEVVRIEYLPDPVPVYDLEIEDTHNFIAGGLCVHNSYVAPNIQNVTTDNRLAGGEENAAAGFRKCIVAGPGCHLYEFDFSGIEARLVGWFARDMAYYRLSGLGVHAYLASHLIGQPADLSWSDADLVEYFSTIKKSFKVPYDMAKRTVHGNGYGMTAKGMFLMFPDLYPTEKAAKGVQDLYFSLAPAVPAWQNATRLRAHEQTYLGGPPRPGFDVLTDPNAHPYGYRHDFWAVVLYRPVGPQAVRRLEAERVPIVELHGRPYAATQGEDAKRCVPAGTQVWMGDYTYRAIEDVRPGDTVIGWRRGTTFKLPSRGTVTSQYMQRRKRFTTDTLVRTQVTATHQHIDTCLAIRFESGRVLRCTADHQWLVLRRHEYVYRQAGHLQVGDQVCRVDVTDPGDCPEDMRLTAAWLGGFYDGEGSHRGVSQTTDNYGVIEEAERAFRMLGFRTTRQPQHRGQVAHWRPTDQLVWTGGRQAALQFVRWVPSVRFRAQWADRMILGSRFRRLDTIVGIEPETIAVPVYCLSTGTQNFIADGFCSHNCLAFYPQSTAAGILKEVLLTLFTDPDHPSYIGDAYFGQTPLRAPIHDSLLLEIPDAVAERVLERVYREMLRPIEEMPLPLEWRTQYGTHLTIGVEGKRGLTWEAMEKLPTPGLAELGLLNEALPIVGDKTYWPAMEDEQEDVDELAGIRLSLGLPTTERIPVVSWT